MRIRPICSFLICAAIGLVLAGNDTAQATVTQRPGKSRSTRAVLSAADQAFLEDLSRRSFRYFQEQTDPHTGLVRDRARTDGSPHGEQQQKIASIAATGFGLTAWCVAAERGWISRPQARERVLATLRFFADRQEHKEGWFYHFVNAGTGEREWKSEVSSIDTSLLLGGVLTARGYFHSDQEIVRLATKIYERVDFPWMLDGHPTLLSMGWRPESG
ncbi:MAG: glucoamylase family protein, partial [Blastocatellia bacterium]